MTNRFRNIYSLSFFILISFIFSNNLLCQVVVRVAAPQPSKLETTLSNTIMSEKNSLITLSDSLHIYGGTQPFTFNWFVGTNLISSDSYFQVTAATSGAYRVVVTDSKGCTSERSVSLVVGMEDIPADEVKIYPVPASTTIIIDQQNETGQYSGSIYNMSGVRVWSNRINGRTSIPVTFPAGAYYIELKGNGRTIIRKILVTH